MPIQRKVFRIEQMLRASMADGSHDDARGSPSGRNDHGGETSTSPARLERPRPSPIQTVEPVGSVELRRLRAEIDAIQTALNDTKQDIAALYADAFGAPARMTRELDAVVASAERAAQQILNAAEDIDEAANTLSASLQREQEQSLALDIRDSVLRIFEACNFQDLSGQRIAKVMATLTFVEQRIAAMIAIGSGVDAIKADAQAVNRSGKTSHRSMVHGPKLDGEAGHASQEEIDAIFAAG